jgi:hypothetical protein
MLAALLVGGVLAPVLAAAQHAGHRASPYAGFEQRAVKALSAEEIADLRSGRGMGLALVAEVNGYPGPVHVIELAAELVLSDRQLAHTRELFEAMRAETVPIGERLIAQESELDRLFADRTVTGATLEAALQSIGATRTALRTAHLRYHLATIAILTAEQVARYSELRGYANSHQPGSSAPGHHR